MQCFDRYIEFIKPANSSKTDDDVR